MGGCLMAERLLKHGKKTNDSTYNGQVYFMKGTDTIHTEKITAATSRTN
jgi:lipopolysaccharide export system protein LptA